MLFARDSRISELENDLTTLNKRLDRLSDRVDKVLDDWQTELLKLSNAKDLMARASARLERAADRQAPPPEEPPPGDAPPAPTELTNPFAKTMLGMKG